MSANFFHTLVSCIIISLLLVWEADAGRRRCPQVVSNNTGFHLTRGVPSPTVYSCLGHYIKVLCCGVGYTSIHWYQLTEVEGVSSYSPVPMRYDVYTEEGNQTLVIHETIKNLSLRCDIEDTAGHKQHYETSVVVFDCGHHSGPPEWVDPKKTEYKASQHDDVSIICVGYYGSSGDLNEHRNQAIWIKQTLGGAQQYIMTRNISSPHVFYDPRVTINTTKKLNGNILISNLSISDVQTKDFAIYICKMSNGIIGGPTIVNFTLEELIPRKLTTRKADVPVIVVLGTLLGLILLVVGVSVFYRLEIKLFVIFLKDRLGLVKDKGDKDYDVFLLYNEDSVDDYEFTRDGLKNQLEKQFNYRVCLSHRDFEPGDVKVNNYLNTLKRSCCMILVISPEFLQDDWCVYTALQALSMTEHPKFILVNFKAISSNDWSDSSTSGRQNSDHKKLKSALKLGYSVTWPGNSSGSSAVSEKKVKRFWKQLRVHMPALPKSTDIEKRNQPKLSGDAFVNLSDGRRNRFPSSTMEPLMENDKKLHVKIREPSNNCRQDGEFAKRQPSTTDARYNGPDSAVMTPVTPGTALTILGSAEYDPRQNPLTLELQNQYRKEQGERASLPLDQKHEEYLTSGDSGFGASLPM